MVFVIKFARLYRHLSSCNTCGCGLLWLFADPCWPWCVPWLSALFCQSWQLPLCSSPPKLRKSFVWLSSHYSSTPPAHSSWLSSHRPNTIAAIQPPPNCWKLWLSSTNSHHSPKTCPATTKSQLSSHHPPKAQKFPHHGCWPAFFILQDQMESKLKFIEHLAWKHPCRPLAMATIKDMKLSHPCSQHPLSCQISTLWWVACKQVMLLDNGKHAFALLHAVFG